MSKGIQKIVVGIIIAIVIIAAGVIYYQVMLPRPSYPESVRVGYVASLTGALASAGTIHKEIVDRILIRINEDGGPYLKSYGKRLPVEMIPMDEESDPSKGVEIATKLIEEMKVDVFVTSSYAHISVPMAKIAERNGVPTLVGCPIEFFEAGGPWNTSWCYFSSFKAFADVFIGLLSKYRTQTNQKVGVLLSDDIIGRAQNGIVPSKLESAGYEVFNPGLYTPGTTDFTSIVMKFRDEDCQILWAHGIPPTFAAFWRQCYQVGYKPKIVFVSGVTRPPDLKAIGGDLPLGLLGEIPWHPSYSFPKSDWLTEIKQQIIADKQINPGYSAMLVAIPWIILRDVLERAGTLDKQAVNNAIKTTDFVGPAGNIRFDSITHTGTGVTSIGQWRKTSEGEWDLFPVWSEAKEVPLEQMIFPIP